MIIFVGLFVLGVVLAMAFLGLLLVVTIFAWLVTMIAKIVAKLAPSPQMEQRVAEMDAQWAKMGQRLRRVRR